MGFCDNEYIVEESIGFIKGDNVFITSGPLKGRESVIKKIDRHKRRSGDRNGFYGRSATGKRSVGDCVENLAIESCICRLIRGPLKFLKPIIFIQNIHKKLESFFTIIVITFLSNKYERVFK